jgi:drug/metabolite transporter (DMT)-like permease
MVPLFGVILGATLLGERLSAVAIAGAAAVLGATILIMRFDQAQPGS